MYFHMMHYPLYLLEFFFQSQRSTWTLGANNDGQAQIQVLMPPEAWYIVVKFEDNICTDFHILV